MNISPIITQSEILPLLPSDKVTVDILTNKIEQLLKLLENENLPPQQRESLSKALNELQQARVLLRQHENASHTARQSGAQMRSAIVDLGDTAKALATKSELQNALTLATHLEKAFDSLNPKQTLPLSDKAPENAPSPLIMTPLTVNENAPDDDETALTASQNPMPIIAPTQTENTESAAPQISSRSLFWMIILGIFSVLSFIWLLS